MTQLSHLTADHLSRLNASCELVEREYVTRETGEVVPSSSSTDASHAAARKHLADTLASIPDKAVVELLALMWLGRGDSGTDFSEILEHARKDFDAHTRGYLAAKSPLRSYIAKGLAASGAIPR
ncbi:DUF3775 domain-containing protein [Paucibacter soli]|uniref:DUF3775 domain-containing protein n=1 Tax=Paucibacter soli TaxID=3133433 RepID=UPI0030A7EC92